jgi:hypothetical protein
VRFIFVVIIATLYYLMDIEGEYLFEKDGKPVFRILNEKTGKKERYIYVCCEECRKKRFQRYDKYRYRKTDLCLQCNGKNNLVVVPTHNLSATKVYQKYMNMLHRCYNPKCKSFPSYGGRGIGMCFEWIGENGLINFNKWCLEKGWTEDSKLQIDRIDNEEDYSPDNCQFITQLENLSKMDNLFGIEGRKVKKTEYANVLDKITEKTNEKGEVLVPLWTWLENIGKKYKSKT